MAENVADTWEELEDSVSTLGLNVAGLGLVLGPAFRVSVSRVSRARSY